MRLFIAIDVGSSVRDRLAEVQPRLVDTKAAVRWVEPAIYHLTVKFLGETDEGLLPEITQRLDRAAGEVPVFPLRFEGLGQFPPRGQPRVIIAHAISPDQRITKLHRLIDSALGGIGLPMDTRVLVPHLTLGRIQSNHGLNRLLRLLRKYEWEPFGSFEVTQAALYRSTLTASGSQYDKLHAAALMVPQVVPASSMPTVSG